MNKNKYHSIVMSVILCCLASPVVLAQDKAFEPPPAAIENETAPQTSTEPAPVPIVPQVTRIGYPLSEVDRPLALPRLMLRPEADFGFVFFRVKDTSTFFGIDLAASMGVMDHLEVGFGLENTPMSELHINRFPLSYTPNAHVGDLPLYGLYEWGNFLDGKIRTAGRLTVNIPLDSHFWMVVDAPTKFKLHNMVALYGDLGMGFQAGDNVSAFIFNIDFGPIVQVIEPLALRLNFGFHIFARSGDTYTFIPIMLRAQYTILGNLDLFADTGFPDVHRGDWYQLIFGACYRFQF